MVAIYCTNCPEYAIAVQACNEQSLVAVPLYDTLGIDACQFVINQTAATFLVVGEVRSFVHVNWLALVLMWSCRAEAAANAAAVFGQVPEGRAGYFAFW